MKRREEEHGRSTEKKKELDGIEGIPEEVLSIWKNEGGGGIPTWFIRVMILGEKS